MVSAGGDGGDDGVLRPNERLGPGGSAGRRSSTLLMSAQDGDSLPRGKRRSPTSLDSAH